MAGSEVCDGQAEGRPTLRRIWPGRLGPSRLVSTFTLILRAPKTSKGIRALGRRTDSTAEQSWPQSSAEAERTMSLEGVPLLVWEEFLLAELSLSDRGRLSLVSRRLNAVVEATWSSLRINYRQDHRPGELTAESLRSRARGVRRLKAAALRGGLCSALSLSGAGEAGSQEADLVLRHLPPRGLRHLCLYEGTSLAARRCLRALPRFTRLSYLYLCCPALPFCRSRKALASFLAASQTLQDLTLVPTLLGQRTIDLALLSPSLKTLQLNIRPPPFEDKEVLGDWLVQSKATHAGLISIRFARLIVKSLLDYIPIQLDLSRLGDIFPGLKSLALLDVELRGSHASLPSGFICLRLGSKTWLCPPLATLNRFSGEGLARLRRLDLGGLRWCQPESLGVLHSLSGLERLALAEEGGWGLGRCLVHSGALLGLERLEEMELVAALRTEELGWVCRQLAQGCPGLRRLALHSPGGLAEGGLREAGFGAAELLRAHGRDARLRLHLYLGHPNKPRRPKPDLFSPISDPLFSKLTVTLHS